MNKFQYKIKEILRDNTYNYYRNFKHPNTKELKSNIKNYTLIYNKLIGGSSKKLTITYIDEKYTFECFDDDNATIKVYVLYSKTNDSECIVLTISKEYNECALTNLTTIENKCSNTLITNIGSHLVNITIELIKKYKDILGINKIILTDHAFLFCKKIKNNILLSDLLLLRSGESFYGKLGFEAQDKKLKKKYFKNIHVINKLKVSDSYIIYYLKKFQEKYSDIDITSIINLAIKYENTNFTDFFKKLSDKNKFDNTCIILNYIIPKIIKKIKLTSFYNQIFIKFI